MPDETTPLLQNSEQPENSTRDSGQIERHAEESDVTPKSHLVFVSQDWSSVKDRLFMGFW